jgi:hypothetical protein
MNCTQAPTPTSFVSKASDTPLSPLFIPEGDLPSSSGCSDPQDAASHDQIPRLRKERTSKIGTMLAALEDLRKARISVMDLLLTMLGGEFSEFYSHRMAFLCDSARIREILDYWISYQTWNIF